MISFTLNSPYTIVGIVVSLISIPRKIEFASNPYVIIITIKKFWWVFGYFKNARAMAIGHIVLLGPNLENNDLEHELIHVEQYQIMPLIFPILYYFELLKRGYRNNKYEEEAYRRAGNTFKEK